MAVLRLSIAFLVVIASGDASAQSALEKCAEHFIGGDIANAPKLTSGNDAIVPLCYRDDDVTFFAVGYRPSDLAPVWAAYKLDPANYGESGCSTFTRKKANCYFRKETFDEFLACPGPNESPSDPFHGEDMLSGTKLASGDFDLTGHDRGHMAPRQALSWHVCATFQSFSMANMSPQRAFLNQDIWQMLERQVLTWAFDHGPIWVVTGATYDAFPASDFEIFEDDGLKAENVYPAGSKMLAVVTKHRDNFTNKPDGDILKPDRTADPTRVKTKIKDMRMPTGYFKLVFRPAQDSEPARLIGFLMPHSFENLNMAANFFENVPTEDAFWFFASTPSLIEQASGMTFAGDSRQHEGHLGRRLLLRARRGAEHPVGFLRCGKPARDPGRLHERGENRRLRRSAALTGRAGASPSPLVLGERGGTPEGFLENLPHGVPTGGGSKVSRRCHEILFDQAVDLLRQAWGCAQNAVQSVSKGDPHDRRKCKSPHRHEQRRRA